MEGVATVLESPEAAIVPGAEAPAPEPELSPEDIPDQDGIDTLEPGEPDDSETEETDPYEGMTPAEIAAKAREGLLTPEEVEADRKRALERQREAIQTEQRQKAALEAAVSSIRDAQAKANATALSAAADKLVKAVEGEIDLDRDGVQEVLREMGQGLSFHALSSAMSSADAAIREMGIPNGLDGLDGDYKVAYLKAAADRDYPGAMRTILSFVRQKQHEASIAWAEAQRRQGEQRAKQDAQEVSKVREPRKAAQGAVQPTANRGSARPAKPRTLTEAAMQFNDGQITSDQYRAYKESLPRS